MVETDRGVQTEQTNPEWTYRFQLVGRRAELVQLHAAIQPIFKHRFGGVVLIRGEAGIGKSVSSLIS
ncbi:ATP-binding protein [Chloroflexi bacterium TSY]|nr:ATP-binding protein [Chloroflexi bacterium TSY]